jgi:hypothetical protein
MKSLKMTLKISISTATGIQSCLSHPQNSSSLASRLQSKKGNEDDIIAVAFPSRRMKTIWSRIEKKKGTRTFLLLMGTLRVN